MHKIKVRLLYSPFAELDTKISFWSRNRGQRQVRFSQPSSFMVLVQYQTIWRQKKVSNMLGASFFGNLVKNTHSGLLQNNWIGRSPPFSYAGLKLLVVSWLPGLMMWISGAWQCSTIGLVFFSSSNIHLEPVATYPFGDHASPVATPSASGGGGEYQI